MNSRTWVKRPTDRATLLEAGFIEVVPGTFHKCYSGCRTNPSEDCPQRKAHDRDVTIRRGSDWPSWGGWTAVRKQLESEDRARTRRGGIP